MRPPSLRPFLPRPALRRRNFQSNNRAYAIGAPSSAPLQVFNDHTKHLQRERSAANAEESRKVDYLRDEVAARLCERLLDIKRNFPTVLDLGANACNIARCLTQQPSNEEPSPIPPSSPSSSTPATPLSTRIDHLVSADTSSTLLHRDASLPFNSLLPSHTRTVLPPSPSPLPFAPQSFSACLSSLSMHWINDLPAHLSQINTLLKPDSPFLAAMLGGDSLYELRTSLQLADLDRRGGVSTHVSPLADVRDMGSLLTRAGFRMLTVDVDDIVVEYPDTFALMTDLQAMGESNATLTREPGPIRRDVLLANEAIYRELHGANNVDDDGNGGSDAAESVTGGDTEDVNNIGNSQRGSGIPATFRIIYMIGWTAGEGQPEPLPRGSGDLNLKDVLGGGDFKK